MRRCFMRKAAILLSLLLVLPSLVFAVSNAKINGQKEITITQLPIDIVFTCDLAQSGNKLAFEYYVDMDGSGTVGPQEPIIEFSYITDGIGWMRDSQDPDMDLAGDETGVDGKIRTTFTIDPEEVFLPVGLTGIFKLVDEDGSTDQVKMHLQIEPKPPFIQGKVTDKSTGAAIPNVFVVAEDEENSNFAIADVNGDYKISVTPGTYKVAATQFPMMTYQPSDTVTVTVTGAQSQTQNFALEPFKSFITGKLTMENGTPVPEILVVATGGLESPFFSMATSDNQGDYKLGVMPGKVAVGPPNMFNIGNENWPKDHYVDPQADTLNINEGETLTSNFVFKPHNSFVSGKCTVDGEGLAGVQINAIAMDISTLSMNFYTTVSDQAGNYKLGVLPGTISSLTADKEGYTVTSPLVGMYFQIEVASGQTVTGKDFGFSPEGDVTSISGNVSFSNGSPASGVYVAAVNHFEDSAESFLIAYTDNSGNYQFKEVLPGYYQVGVFLQGYSSDPEMLYFDLDTGTEMAGQDFVLGQGTSVEIDNQAGVVKRINLSQNFPNPFNPSTTIAFELPKTAKVEINIFNARGQKVRSLVNNTLNAGYQRVEWDGRDDAEQKLPSGFYMYQLKTDNFNKVMKMILTK